MSLRMDVPTRSVTDVGPDDFVKVDGVWEQIVWNTAYGVKHTPRQWTVSTVFGVRSMWDIDRYARAEDFE
jgi:hypothetical protein